METNNQDIKNLFSLAKIKVNKEEQETLTRKIAAILDFVKEINVLDTTNVAPMARVLPETLKMYDDQPEEENNLSCLMKLSSHQEANLYIVPKVIEDQKVDEDKDQQLC